MSSPGGTARWPSPAHLASHFEKHEPKLGFVNGAEYDASAHTTIRAGRRFTYEDPASGEARVGYFDRRSGCSPP